MRARLTAALGDRYEFTRELAGGGMSHVWLARERALGRDVVIKVVGDGTGVSAERFAREVQLAARLQQANIVPLLTAGEVDGLPYYTMPYVDGQSLRDRLGRGALSPTEAVDVLREVARALAYAHAQGVVHRDIKPENILLSSGAAVVTDFGIAKALRAARTLERRDEAATTNDHALTQAGTSLGTPGYMAPEQALGEDADARADLYAWGVVAYELLAGRHPFAHHRTPSKLVAAHLAEAPAPLPVGIPAPLAALVLQCLAKEPSDRPASANALVTQLTDTAMRAEPARSAAPMPMPGGSRRVMLAGLGIVVIAALGWWAMRGATTAGATSEPKGTPATPAVTAAPEGSIAVLPFVNLSGSANDEYFSDGLTDELANAIRNLPGLRLAGRSSSYAFKGKNAPATEVGRTLGVRTLIEGTVRRSGSRVRLAAQLTSATTGEVLWSDVFENTGGDVFAIQDTFTRAIVARITPLLSQTASGGEGAARAGGAESRGTDDARAYDLYLRGRYYWAQRGAASLDTALGLFKQAVVRDPRFARGWAGLALTHVLLPNYDARVAPLPAFDSARVAAARALALDSTVADAWSAIGLAQLRRLQFAEGERAIERARTLDPQNATVLHWSSFIYSIRGDLEGAERQRSQALARDPLAATILNNQVIGLVDQRRFAEARPLSVRLRGMSPLFSVTQAFVVDPVVRAIDGTAEEAWAEQERILRDPVAAVLVPPARGARGGRLLTAAATGRWPAARAIRDSITTSPAAATSSWDRAIVSLIFGTRSEAAQHFVSASENEGAFGNLYFSICAPLLDLVRNEPVWRAFLTKYRLPDCPYRSTWPEIRAPENRG